MFQQVMYDTMKRKAEYSEQKETKNKRIEREKKNDKSDETEQIRDSSLNYRPIDPIDWSDATERKMKINSDPFQSKSTGKLKSFDKKKGKTR